MNRGVRAARRPAGWVAPGPAPRGPGDRADLWPAEGEDLSYLSGDWRIFQPRRGHRWSLDDLVTASVACEERAPSGPPVRALDMGCGLGSVLMMVAWRFPEASVVGLEAQPARAALARRSLAYNGADGRCVVLDADLREPASLPVGARFELVTGTPPYFPRGDGVEPLAPQVAPCRFEHRGGVEDYVAAGARWLADVGTLVLCAASGEAPRVASAARVSGLRLGRALDVIPRAGKAPLVTVFTLWRAAPDGEPCARASLVVRDALGAWTREFAALRRGMGLPDTPPRA